ncbi:hypothetical protein RP20_CCG015262 [Aedes albopictus]|nr:uncharacterized protein LOC109408727 [Aedes albopictus]KXJ73682.1 hypothetical protein RP20_CCG015262 [Aedes albopictus]
MEDDLNHLSGSIIDNLDKFNRILKSASLESKLLTDPDLPDRLLKLSQQEWTPTSDPRSADPSDRLTADDLDAIFSKIRHRPAGGTSSRGVNRVPSQKKAVPLQQSRILNETNLASSPSGSLTDLSDSGGSKRIIDVEALVKSLKHSIQAMGQIENRPLEAMDFERVERYNRRECVKVRDAIRDVELMVQDLERYVASVRGDDGDRKELVSEILVSRLRDLSETMSQVIFIKNNEYIPDMNQWTALGSFPLAECLDDVNENIRRKKLYQ